MQSRLHIPDTQDSLLTPEEIFLTLGEEPDVFREEVQRNAPAAPSQVSSMARYLHDGGGKRVRPALLLQASRVVCGEVSSSAIRMAAVMEMLHTATLVHDDIIDDARVRRGRA